MLEMKCKIFADNQRIFKEDLERDNMLKEAQMKRKWLLMLK
jgi:hypothetical protein